MQRMKLYTKGVTPPKLGTVQDRVIRQYLTHQSQVESKKVQLLALLVANSVVLHDQTAQAEWGKQVKTVWTQYLGLEYGVEIPELSDKEQSMMDYYQKVVKDLKPKLHVDDKGNLSVTGLDKLNG